ncbi:MAG: DUF1062 domain-containing protein [Oscillospiraceae bacterium]|nr:DUF1062 domain-containing protein [Oscillospiraceae bacterium]
MSKNDPGGRPSGTDNGTIPQREAGPSGAAAGENPQNGRPIRVYHRCGGCGKKQEFLNSGRFRVNANGNLVDVWLIYRCKKCKHSWNLTICERTKPAKIPTERFEAFQTNDAETAAAYGRNIDFLKKNHAEFK